MPSHVYHEVSLAHTGRGRFWVSFGEARGVEWKDETFVERFVREFTFDTRYEVETDGDEPPPKDKDCPILACFVSNGYSDPPCIYAYEVAGVGQYNAPRVSGWDADFKWTNDRSEEYAIRAMAYSLMAEAVRRQRDHDF